MLGTLTRELISHVCPSEHQAEVAAFLESSCSNTLPGVGSSPEWAELIDRVQLAAIRGSEWKIEKIKKSVVLANQDWRDLLVASGFSNDLSAHKHWQKWALEERNVS